MKQTKLLKDSIETLKLFQKELHDTLDSSKQAELAKIIQNLEQCNEIKKSELIQILNKILPWLPVFKQVVQQLLDFLADS